MQFVYILLILHPTPTLLLYYTDQTAFFADGIISVDRQEKGLRKLAGRSERSDTGQKGCQLGRILVDRVGI